MQKKNALKNDFENQFSTVVYRELKQIATRILYGGRGSTTLNPTSLVHEAYLKISAAKSIECIDEQHYCVLAARAMRQIMIDYYRYRAAEKRNFAAEMVSLKTASQIGVKQERQYLELHAALGGLAEIDSLQAQIVELRFFGGYTIEETARILHISKSRTKREFAIARLWLVREIRHSSGRQG